MNATDPPDIHSRPDVVARLEAALRAKSAEMDALLDAIPVGIGIAKDPQCKDIRVNRALAEILGLKPSQNASKTAEPDERPTNFICMDVEGRPIPDEQLPMQISAREGQPVCDLEFMVVRDDGRVVRLLEYAVPLLDEAGAPRGCVAVFVDITERNEAEERERRRLAELAHFGRLGVAGEMVSELAHEMSQPLSAARNFALAGLRMAKLSAGSQTTELCDLLEKVVAQTERAGQIVARMSSFVKKSKPARALIDVNETVRDVIALTTACFGPNALGGAPVALRAELAPGLPNVLADRVQIEQVLFNLIRNGIEASRDGAAADAAVVVRTSPVGGSVRISVIDSGQGVAAQHLPQIFQPFFTTKAEGMGLGLSISKSIVESHNGRMWIDDSPARGAKFSFSLPSAESALTPCGERIFGPSRPLESRFLAD